MQAKMEKIKKVLTLICFIQPIIVDSRTWRTAPLLVEVAAASASTSTEGSGRTTSPCQRCCKDNDRKIQKKKQNNIGKQKYFEDCCDEIERICIHFRDKDML